MSHKIDLSCLAKSGASLLAIAVACASSSALAQTAPSSGTNAPAGTAPTSNAPDAGGSAVEEPTSSATTTSTDEVVVVGSRASQQSANNRKRNARTATDSIVADDIGSFPDRNVNEAISRIPGVALARNDFGEGEGVAVRGNGPDLTRIELDGVGVQSTNALAIANASGRAADLRELPAELVKSVDVVKGSTADMTEGSLGGTVQIKTRTGLDFTKPYISLRAGSQRNSLGREWTPDFNAVVASRFLDNRLGVIASGSFSKIQNNAHGYENTVSGNRGYARLFDFDQSPEKTFTFNPDTVTGDAASVPFPDSTAPDGSSLTPLELVTLAAGATSKAQCYQIFPHVAATASTGARNQRVLEQQSCLNQWNDYTPSLIRNFMNTQTDKRLAFDARVDYRLTDNLTVFAKGTVANRKVHDQNRSRTPVSLFNQNPAGSFVDTTTGYPRIRTLSPNAPAGYYLFPDSLISVGNNATLGQVVNVNPASVTVDEAHNVTQMTLTNNTVNIDQIENQIDTKSKYAQVGAEWRSDRLEIDLWGGMTKASTSRGDMRTSRQYAYGDATLTLQPNGLWDIDLPDNYDESDPNNFVQLRPAACVAGGTNPATCIGQAAIPASPTVPVASPAYRVTQLPLTTPAFSVQYTPALGESTEKIAKFDVGYKTDEILPFFTRFKSGLMFRNQEINRWNNGGYTRTPAVGTFGQPGYVPAVIVPRAIVRGSYRACQPTATSSAPGGLGCNYGFVQSTDPALREGVDTLTPDQMRDLLSRTLENSDSKYFGDLPNRGNLPSAWQGIRTDRLFAELGASQFMNFDCLKRCEANDGNVYDQPVSRANETIKNVYAMTDFEQQLPFGLLFNGNVGVRGVFASIEASGLQTLSEVRVTPAYNPANPNATAGIITRTYSFPVTFKQKTRDWLPSANLNLWGFDESVVLRLYGGKTVARPNMNNLIPGGTCITFDEREVLDTTDQDSLSCSGRVGNPGLKPFTAWSYNASLEWYPNRDTVLSVARGKLDVKIGAPIGVTRAARPFVGSSEIDPVTGTPLSEIEFLVPTFDNGPGYKRTIWEFQAKTAFTFLPWFLRNTGADVNLSILSSSATSGTRDPLTGDVMLPPDESKYYTNASVWYDDGKLNLRVAYQKRTQRFAEITPGTGGNSVDINYPGEGYGNVRLVGPGYNPGVPRFLDGSTFIDAKASYNINRHFQIYVEARNLRREAQTISFGEYVPFEDGSPKIVRLNYGGRRIMGGVRVQFGN